MNLNSRHWKEFRVGDIFEIEKCKCNNVSKLGKGEVPYVGATNRNNGVMSFVENNSNLVTKGNCIAFISDGQGSCGYSIYKQEDFIGSTTLKVGRNEKLNKYIGLFLTTALDKNKIIYDYGYKRTESRLRNEIIYLPSIEDEPDWNFMELYIKEKYFSKKTRYKNYSKEVVNSIKSNKIVELKEKEWKEFFITDIFDIIQRGKRLKKADQLPGETPYISSTALNNGIDNFISNTEKVRIFSNCLTIANSGSVGSSFYHPYKFVASDHVTHLKNVKFNKYIYLFISTMTGYFSNKYNFNREINDKRISREKIMLPITSNGEPDYEYMENYIKNIMVSKYLSYE